MFTADADCRILGWWIVREVTERMEMEKGTELRDFEMSIWKR